MATIQQIEANRLNAQKSTGPRSVEGKAVSCFNAIKKAQIWKPDPECLLGLGFDYGCEQFSRLQRRIDSTSRNYHRALKELQRLDSERREPDPPPDEASAASPPAPSTRPFPAPVHPSPASIKRVILTKKYRLAKLVSAQTLGA
jgi:hypothetical protein